MSKEDVANAKGGRSLWNAPVGAKSDSLNGAKLEPPNADEARRFIEAAMERTDKRAKAYQTSVTQQTLGRKIR